MIGHKDFPSRSGGVEVMVGGLARSLVERGYDVTVYNRGLEKHHNVYDVDGVHARRVFTLQKPALNATIYSFLATFDALFRGFDVIHYHAIEPSVPLLIAKLFGKHTVCTVHGLNWKVDKWRGFASRYMKLGEKIAAKYADDLVVLSETEWNYFLQKYDRASILIPNAIRFYEKRPCNLIREKYGLKQGEYILYVGRISPEKGTIDLVEGYRKAKTGKKLVLVGPLDDRFEGLSPFPEHNAHRARQSGALHRAGLLNGPADFLALPLRVFLGPHPLHNSDKLIPAIPHEDIRLPRVGLQQPAEIPDELVALGMSVGIVDLL